LGNDPDRERDRHRAHTLFRSVGCGSFGLADLLVTHVPRALLRLAGQVMATTTLVAPEYAYRVAGNSDALYDLREPEPSQSFGDLEKLLWLAVTGISAVNSMESEREQTGIIREQIRGTDER
jgi:hypothetical protein